MARPPTARSRRKTQPLSVALASRAMTRFDMEIHRSRSRPDVVEEIEDRPRSKRSLNDHLVRCSLGHPQAVRPDQPPQDSNDRPSGDGQTTTRISARTCRPRLKSNGKKLRPPDPTSISQVQSYRAHPRSRCVTILVDHNFGSRPKRATPARPALKPSRRAFQPRRSRPPVGGPPTSLRRLSPVIRGGPLAPLLRSHH
jgi:hypothetical protein